ncbi:LppP/LprE family lipoprotein [Nocardia sp. AG03]|uniref:LppP/LprE family lipoprotein n=1 Tax=Nocardia sp. AG03 TaxID=3025312 RepID=UPI00241882B7|nr:LppP/LprE family lipoprotein [Nocardia sp. AG03]
MSALVAIAAGLVAGCTDSDGVVTLPSTSRATTSAPAPSGDAAATTAPGVTPAPDGDPAVTPAPGGGAPAVTPAPGGSEVPADDIGGPGRCIDPASTGVRDAVAGLGGGWVATQAATDVPGDCGQLLWVRAVGGNSAGAPIHILFFHDGTYLGTATSEPYAFTSVSGSNGNAVSVDYKWLVADEPFAAPQGGPATITYTWTGSGVVMSDPLPPEVTQPHR